MIIRYEKLGMLAEAVTELEAHYIGFDPAHPALRSEGMAALMIFSKVQWSDAITIKAPRIMGDVPVNLPPAKELKGGE